MFHLVFYLYLMYQNFLACAVEVCLKFYQNFLAWAVEVCLKFSIQWKVWEKLSTIKFLTGEEYDRIYFTYCIKILHDQCSVLLFIKSFTFFTNNTLVALIGRNPFRACLSCSAHTNNQYKSRIFTTKLLFTFWVFLQSETFNWEKNVPWNALQHLFKTQTVKKPKNSL